MNSPTSPAFSAAGVCLVTGVAGFIGSHLADSLLAAGCRVRGVDCFTDYYARPLKERNLEQARRESAFELVEADLVGADLNRLLEDVTHVFHQAGQAGVRASWGSSFETYLQCNVMATQRLLEACRHRDRPPRFVYASSSSVYGDSLDLPSSERSLPQPISPYGVTKLAGEHLCRLYARLGVPTVSLRYFTVYGPRQRPDMAFSRFIAALTGGSQIAVYGDGEQTRDFTYVSDIVGANLAAAGAAQVAGSTFNLGGGSRVTVNHVLDLLQKVTGCVAAVRYDSEQPGDTRHTQADCSAARQALGFTPQVSLESGLRAQVEWTLEQRSG